MQNKYQITQHKIYKAIIRPVLYFGVPLELFFCISALIFGIGFFFSPIIWFSIPVVILSLGMLTRKDAFFFHILYLKWKTSWSMCCRLDLSGKCFKFDQQKRLAAKANRLLGCQIVSSGRYTADTKVGTCKVVRRERGFK